LRFQQHYTEEIMLVPKPPKSVHDNRPVAVLVVKQEKSGAVDKHVVIVDTPKPEPAVPKPK
jgi:hypothetical protein